MAELKNHRNPDLITLTIELGVELGTSDTIKGIIDKSKNGFNTVLVVMRNFLRCSNFKRTCIVSCRFEYMKCWKSKSWYVSTVQSEKVSGYLSVVFAKFYPLFDYRTSTEVGCNS